MKIAKATIAELNIELAEQFSYALATLDYLPYLLVTVELENGIRGYGEVAAGWDTTGEVQPGAIRIFGIVHPLLVGKTINGFKDIAAIMEEISAVIFENTALKCGIEAALLDALGKKRRIPVSLILRGKKKKSVLLQKTFSFEEQAAENFQAAAREAYRCGAKIFKLKVGNDPRRIKRSLVQLSALKLGVKIVLDANQSWKDARRSLEMIGKLKGYAITWIEQPVHRANYGALSEIRKKSKMPIMADESCHNFLDLENLHLRKAIDLVNIKLAKCGGIVEVQKMIRYCDQHGIGYILGDMLHSSLGTALNLQAATLGNFVSYDLTLSERIKKDPFLGIRFEGFTAHIPAGPGLGVTKS